MEQKNEKFYVQDGSVYERAIWSRQTKYCTFDLVDYSGAFVADYPILGVWHFGTAFDCIDIFQKLFQKYSEENEGKQKVPRYC